MSAGENPFEIEKVKCFHDAVFGYSSFIYELKPDSSFEDLKSAYENVFAKLKSDPDLPEKYSDSARNLAWFEKALDTQGSIEKCSLERAFKINNSGLYIVRYAPDPEMDRKVLVQIEDVVLLEYQEEPNGASGKKLSTHKLRLSELRDLLSRLMLIVGKEKHEHTDNVDVFISTFQNIERLASSFVSLYNSGCAFFRTLSVYIRTYSHDVEFPAIEIRFSEVEKPLCAYSMHTNDELSGLCVALESIKVKWDQYIFAMRCKHPILNEFNVQQLSVLCSALAKLKRSNSSNHLGPSAKYYLDSINELINLTDLVKILKEDYNDGADVDDQTESLIVGDASIPLDEIIKNGYTDQRSALLSMIESFKIQLNSSDELVKAGIQAVRNSITDNRDISQEDEDKIVNWIIDNEEQNEVVAQFAQEFDYYFSTLDRNETAASEVEMCGNNVHLSNYSQKMETIFDKYLSGLKENALDDFVNLHQLAHVLNKCQDAREDKNEVETDNRQLLPKHFKPGRPNLVLCDKRSDILLCILSLYRYVTRDSLPNHNQVLLCSSRTSVEELELFLLRALLDPRTKVYTIAFADDVSPACSDQIEKLLIDKATHANPNYKLVVFNCDETSQVSVTLEKFKIKQGEESRDDLRNYLCNNLKSGEEEIIDQFRTRLITSTQPSSGNLEHIATTKSLSTRLLVTISVSSVFSIDGNHLCSWHDY